MQWWWPGTGLNRRRRPFQGRALPLSYLASVRDLKLHFICADSGGAGRGGSVHVPCAATTWISIPTLNEAAKRPRPPLLQQPMPIFDGRSTCSPDPLYSRAMMHCIRFVRNRQYFPLSHWGTGFGERIARDLNNNFNFVRDRFAGVAAFLSIGRHYVPSSVFPSLLRCDLRGRGQRPARSASRQQHHPADERDS